MGIVLIIYLAVFVLVIAGYWKMFEKAGAKGWMAIIPILNLYVLAKMAGKSGWWVVLMLIPFVNFVVIFIIFIEIAHRFDRSTGFGVGMTLLGFIFVPIIGFGDAAWTAEPVDI
ncbi:MAG TPA: signal peptidase I [Actinobacteria bacterium]|nr:signal peptidase I [Actinomycetota bacterium]